MAHRAPLIIAPYTPTWSAEFAAERTRIVAALAGEPCHIEHVGSTAVPGLAAKPIIDILLGAPDLALIESWIPRLETLGYEYLPHNEIAFPDRRFLAWPDTRPRKFHLHGVAIATPFWREHLAFRDVLRADPALAQEYAILKQHLAAHFIDDREAYTEAKGPFIKKALRRAGN
jgi:GrpB-like predicted nucleotidyltransferase (UPF0157 family)